MTYPIISEYVESILSAEDNFKELTNLRPVLKADGTPYMTSGNFAVVFKMREEDTGKLFAVKCFLKEQEKRTESYKLISEELEYVQSSYLVHIRYMEDELFVDSANSDQNEFPILLMDWVEGDPLDAYLRKNLYDEYARKMLAYRFCAMSSWLMSQPFAHGDLKPDNILVREDGTLVLVDYDGMFVPAMKGQTARELGSPDFRHPLRENTDFDEHIDDFSIASIALSLKAISLDADLLDKYGDKDRLLFSQTDYQNISASQTIAAMQSLLADVEFERLMGVFILAHSMKNLSAISFRAIQIGKPEKVEREQLSTEVTDEEIKNGIEDEYGVIYSRDGKRLLKCKNYKLGKYVIKSETRVICDSAFCGRSVLTCIEIPESVMSIGDSAFSSCSGLTSIEIPDSVTSIGDRAFENCWNLMSIVIPDSVTSIGNHTFCDCYGLTSIEIPDSVTSIGDSAFIRCGELTNIKIPDSVTSIGDRAFAVCWNLTSIEIPNSVTSIGDSAFAGSGLTSINVSIKNRCYDSRENCNAIIESKTNKLISGCANTKVPDSVMSIGDSAFRSCHGLTSIEIPDSVTSIGNRAFAGSGLTSIEIPDSVTSIGDSAFEGCGELTSIKIPDSVTSIGDSAFLRCSGLTSIEIPDSVTSVGDRAFAWSGLTSIEIPDSVTSIGNKAFVSCIGLTIINVSIKNRCYDSRENCNAIIESKTNKLISGCANTKVPDSVTSIGDSAFRSCHGLTSIVIPDSVTSIGDDAFAWSGLTSIEIPDSVTSIGNRAFSGCEELTSIKLPKSVTSIGERAFDCCRGLTSIEIPDSVTSIGEDAFNGCENLKIIWK